jgi:hypothetical protein
MPPARPPPPPTPPLPPHHGQRVRVVAMPYLLAMDEIAIDDALRVCVLVMLLATAPRLLPRLLDGYGQREVSGAGTGTRRSLAKGKRSPPVFLPGLAKGPWVAGARLKDTSMHPNSRRLHYPS